MPRIPVLTLNDLRRLAARPPLRGVLLQPAVRRLLASLFQARFLVALRLIERPGAFMLAEIRRAGTATYRLRGTNVRLVVRHDTGGLELLYEIFHARCYEPPWGVAQLIPRAPRVLDLGANVGAFAAYAMTRWSTASLTCVEPDPENLVALRTLHSIHPEASMSIVPACAMTSEGSVGFNAGLGAGSRVTEGSPQAKAVDAMPLMREADFAKIDIEGSEWAILRDARLGDTAPLVLVMEYHRRFPYDSGASAEARHLLGAAGFRVVAEKPNFWGHGLLWAVKSGSIRHE